MIQAIERIISEYDKQGVSLLTTTKLSSDVPDVADLETRQVVFNKKSILVNQVPFRLAHELMHIVHAEPYSRRMVAYHGYDVGNPEERMANNQAIKFLMEIYMEEAEEFNWLQFMEAYGVPSYLEYRVKCFANNREK